MGSYWNPVISMGHTEQKVTSFSGNRINCPCIALVFPNDPPLLSDAKAQDISLSLIFFLIFSPGLFLWCPLNSNLFCYSSPEHSRGLISNQPCWDSSGIILYVLIWWLSQVSCYLTLIELLSILESSYSSRY